MIRWLTNICADHIYETQHVGYARIERERIRKLSSDFSNGVNRVQGKFLFNHPAFPRWGGVPAMKKLGWDFNIIAKGSSGSDVMITSPQGEQVSIKDPKYLRAVRVAISNQNAIWAEEYTPNPD